MDDELHTRQQLATMETAVDSQRQVSVSASTSASASASASASIEGSFVRHMSLSDSLVDITAIACDEEEELERKRNERRRLAELSKLSEFKPSSPQQQQQQQRDVRSKQEVAKGIDQDHEGSMQFDTTSSSNPFINDPAPGAIRVTGVDGTNENSTSIGTIKYGESTTSFGRSDFDLDMEEVPTEMVTAQAVTAEEVEATVLAQMMRTSVAAENVVKISEDKDREPVSKGSKARWRPFIIVGLLIVVVAAIVGAAVGAMSSSDGNDENEDSIFTETLFSSSPSATPSLAPTLDAFSEIYSRVAIYPSIPFPGPDSPQYHAIKFLYEQDPNFDTYGLHQLKQRYGLLTMVSVSPVLRSLPLAAFQGFGWFTGDHECDWVGLGCDPTNTTVITMEISFLSQITGTLPPEVGLLSGLERIITQDIRFGGQIPSEIGLFTKMTHGVLAECNFEGTIPSEVAQLGSVEYLGFWGNKISGTLPTSITKLGKLKHLIFSDNMIGGPVPSYFGILTGLRSLQLNGNELTGFPTELGLMHQMEGFFANNNPLNSTIPTEVGLMTSLRYLNLSMCELFGTLPSEIGNLRELRVLRITGNNLTGTLPSELGLLENLEILDVSKNSFQGGIPMELGNLKSLELFFAGANGFMGTVPPGSCTSSNQSRYTALSLDCDRVVCPCCTSCCNEDPSDCSDHNLWRRS